jgi:hypothetical protein
MIAYGLHYQPLASQDGSKVVWDEIAIRIFFKSLQLESIQTQTRVLLDFERLIQNVNSLLQAFREVFQVQTTKDDP